MSFGDSFARGYAVGDSFKKRRAASKFFEKFKELSADDEGDGEMVAPDGTAIPMQAPAEAVAPPASPSTAREGALPVAPAQAAQPAAPAQVATPAEPAAQAAIPVETPPTDTAAPAIPTSPAAEPLAAAPAKGKKGEKKGPRSVTQDDVKELDRLAMDAARAAGDVEVYTALQRTTDTFLQNKVLRNMSLAQQASDNGDVDATEKYLQRAYRWIPDGQEIKFQRKEDGLYVQDPWDAKNQIKLGSEQIGYIATKLLDPQKWSEIVRQERKDRQQQGLEERKVKAQERGVEIDADRVNVAREQLGISREELGMKNREVKLKELMAPVERLETYQRALYYSALGEQAKAAAAGKGGKDALDVTLDDAREMGKEVDDQFQKYTAPPVDPITGKPSADWQAPEDVAGLSAREVQTANGLAQAIGARNAGKVSPAMAVQAGLALARAGAGKGEVEIMADKGLMLFDYNGVQTPVMLPSAVIEGLVQQEQARRQQSAGGLPTMPAPAANPVAPPAPLFR